MRIQVIVKVVERLVEKSTLINNILRRKVNWFGHILRRNFLLQDVTEGQMTEIKGVEIRRTQLLDNLINTRGYWELMEGVEDQKR